MTPQQLQAMKLALEALKNNKLTHLYCEDTWYSCPKHEDGCANEAEGDECNCGADDVNAQFDQAIIALEEALAQPDQEPVAWMKKMFSPELGEFFDYKDGAFAKETDCQGWTPLYTTPPQRKPLTDAEIENALPGYRLVDAIYIARAIEAAHGIKENT